MPRWQQPDQGYLISLQNVAFLQELDRVQLVAGPAARQHHLKRERSRIGERKKSARQNGEKKRPGGVRKKLECISFWEAVVKAHSLHELVMSQDQR